MSTTDSLKLARLARLSELQDEAALLIAPIHKKILQLRLTTEVYVVGYIEGKFEIYEKCPMQVEIDRLNKKITAILKATEDKFLVEN